MKNSFLLFICLHAVLLSKAQTLSFIWPQEVVIIPSDYTTICGTEDPSDDYITFYNVFTDCYTNSPIVNGSDLTGEENEGYYSYTYDNTVKEIRFQSNSRVTEIGSNAFSCCFALESISLPNSLETIGLEAFYYCNKLKSISIPSSVTSIGYYAFRGCSGLTSVTIPNSVTDIGIQAFAGCRGTLSVNCNIPGVPINSSYTFTPFYRSSFSSVIIGNGVTSIGNYAFYDSRDLTSVTIPSSVTSIGVSAFSGCSDLISVKVGMETPLSINSSSFTNRANATLYVPVGSKAAYQAADYWKDFKEIVEYTITFADANVKAICVQNWDTDGDGELSLDEAAAVTNLRTAFQNKRDITSFDELQYFTGLTSIGDRDFYGCSSLTSVTIPNSVTSIGNLAFSDCSGLSSVTIGNSVTSIGEGAFQGCSGLSTVTIGNSVTSIGDRVFYGCSGLTSVTIPNSVTSIGEFAFNFCSGLTSITIPNSVTSIGNYVFCWCSGLTSITIPNSVTSIGDGAFSQCSGLTSITIPKSVTSIGDGILAYCDSLASIVVDGDNPVYDSRENCNSIIETATNTLIQGCMNSIIPENVTSVGKYAFLGFLSLSSITIPTSVAYMGDAAFHCTHYAGSSGLLSIKMNSAIPITIHENCFNENSFNYSTLYVPKGSKTAYQAADYWKEFKNIVEYEGIEQTLALETLPSFAYGDDVYTLPETTAEGLTLSWTSDNAAVAIVNGNVLTVKGAGTATITAAQAGNGDYKAFSREFSLTVGKAALTITANDCTKVEGEENPELTVSYEGFKNGDTEAVLTRQPTVTTQATTASPAGSYPITVSGAEAANYDISYVDGTLTVEEAPLEPTDISQVDNAIYVEKAQGGKGGSGTIVIGLKNAQAATAYQFNLKLPEGVTLKTNNEGEYTCTLSSRHRGHNANINTLEDEGVYRIVVSSMQSKMIDGNVLAIAVDVSDDLELGSYPIFIQDARYSLLGGTAVHMQETIGVFDVEDFLLGDVNNDGDIDVADVVCIVNNSIGKPNDTFMGSAADVDRDGEIDIADAVKLVNYIIKKISVLSHHGIDNTTIDLPEPQ